MPPPQQVADLARADGDELAELAQAAAAQAALAAQPAVVADPARWRDRVADLAPQLLALQQAGIEQADPYLSAVLEAQDADPTGDGQVNAPALLDLTDGGGSWLRNLVFAPPAAFEQALAGAASRAAAAVRARFVASAVAGDGVADIGRSARMVAMAARPAAKTWVRALRGTSCARCAILAGRRYRISAFRRHPRCDCYMIPAAEDADGWETNPTSYFRSLSRDLQDRIFTLAGAEAIRLGADMSQVVNAQSGITTVTALGRQVQATTYGTSVRGLYGGYLVQPDGTLVRRPSADTERRASGTRSLRFATAPRLMPDEIFLLAEQEGWDREQVLTQLRRFAYLT